MLHVGRSPGGPSYGASSLGSPQLYCASRSLYIRCFLNRTYPLLWSKRYLVGCPRAGIPPSPLFVTRKLALARAFVQEHADKEEPEGVDESDAFIIPIGLPWTVTSSLAVHNWGTIHHGPLEARYFNPAKKFPYPVGFMSIKVYKGKDYCQSIEEGPQGPVFVVKDAFLGEFKAESPQKVWTKVCEISAVQVHGMRHFGFESSEVIRVLQAMHFQSKKFSRYCSEQLLSQSTDIASQVDVSSPLSSAKDDANMGFYLGDTQFFETEAVVNDTDDIDASADDVYDGSVNYEADKDDDDNEVLGIINNDGQYNEEDVSVNAYTDNKTKEFTGAVTHDSEKLKSYLKNNEMVHFLTDEFANKRVVRPSMRRSTLTRFKRSFKAGPRKFTFFRGPWGSHDAVKQDSVQGDGKVTTSPLFSIPFTSRQKPSLPTERQIWRKGEGLSGYVPGHNEQRGTENQRVVEQGEYFSGGVPGYDRQQAAEKVRAGEQVSGQGKTEWERIVEDSNDSRASESNANVMKSRGSSISEAKEESLNSSKSLLELLDKWNRSKEWDHERDTLQKRRLQRHVSQGEDVDFFKQLNVENEIPFSVPGSGIASQVDVSPEKDDNDLRSNKLIDESTNFAISTLFETEAKPRLLWNEQSKPMLNGVETRHQDIKSRKIASTSKQAEILDDGSNFAAVDNPSGLKTLAQVDVTMSRELREEGNIFESLEEKIGMTEQAANEVRLIEDVKRLIANKSFGNVLEKVKAMKLSGMMIKEDVYEAILGFELDPWQRQVFKQVQDGNSVLISAPSGAGKSAVANCCIFNNVVNEKRALFVTPYEHLATWNLRKFKILLGESNVGGMGTGTSMQESPSVVVITLKVLSKILHDRNGTEFRFFLDGVNMVVLDKFCTFNEAKYVRLWEEVLMLLNPKLSVIVLTLPATNEKQIAAWMSMSRGPCKLISCKSETILKRYLFCCKDGLYPLLNPEGLQANKNLYKARKVCGNSASKDQLESSLWSGFDRLSLTNMLNMFEVNALLPAIVMFLDVKSCDNAMHDVLSNEIDNLLSMKEIECVEAFLKNLENKHSSLWNYVDKADCEGLLKGFAVYHEGKLPLWQDIVMDFFQKNLVKVLIVTDSSLLHTDFTARTVVISDIRKVTQNGVFFIGQSQLLQLVGRAGRRGFDIEGNIVFLESIHCGPEDAASLLLNNTFSYFSSFKPSYSLVANLMAKHNLLEVKRIVSRSFAVFQFFTEYTKARKLKELDQEIFCCLERKADLDSKLFEGLMEVNKHKLSNSPIFTRVDIRIAVHSSSQSGNVLPGILLAVVPGPAESFYMVFGTDNCFRLVPAGALDHVYVNEVSPLDVVVKKATGQELQPPLVPPKESWSLDEVSSFGYIATGSSQTKEYVKLMMQYQVQPIIAKEGLQLRKDIFVLEAQLSNFIEKRKLLQTETFSSDWKHLTFYKAEAATWQVHESEIWKETIRILQVLEKVDAMYIIDSAEAYATLKPLGMLISRLHDLENELWLAVAMTSKHVEVLSPAEFAGFLATVIPRDPERESLFFPGKELSYRVTKSLKDAFTGLEVLRRQVATLQGSYNPSLQFDTGFSGLVYAWAQGEPTTSGNYVMSTNDGDLAWRLRSIARLASLLCRACTHVSVGTYDRNHYRNLSSLAKKAEGMLLKHLIALDRT